MQFVDGRDSPRWAVKGEVGEGANESAPPKSAAETSRGKTPRRPELGRNGVLLLSTSPIPVGKGKGMLLVQRPATDGHLGERTEKLDIMDPWVRLCWVETSCIRGVASGLHGGNPVARELHRRVDKVGLWLPHVVDAGSIGRQSTDVGNLDRSCWRTLASSPRVILASYGHPG